MIRDWMSSRLLSCYTGAENLQHVHIYALRYRANATELLVQVRDAFCTDVALWETIEEELDWESIYAFHFDRSLDFGFVFYS